MKKEVDLKYVNITAEVIMLFIDLCRQCQEKATKKRKGLVVKPMVFKDLNCRGQVDLIDMQTQAVGEYKWILNYQVDNFRLILQWLIYCHASFSICPNDQPPSKKVQKTFFYRQFLLNGRRVYGGRTLC